MHKNPLSMLAYICSIFRYSCFAYASIYYSHHKGNSPDNRDSPPQEGQKGRYYDYY